MDKALRLLLIEDSLDDAALVVRELKKAGYAAAFERVDNRTALLAALDHGPWDVVLCDYSMPGFNGKHALELLRSRDQDTPFIFVSGTIGEDVAVDAMRAGAQDYVIKGNLRRLVPAIEREIGLTQARRERRASEARFRRVVESAMLGILFLETTGRITDANDEFLRIIGYTRKDLAAGRINWHEITPPEHREKTARALLEIARRGSCAPYEKEYQRKDGTLVPVLVGGALLDAPGSGVAFVLDMSERKTLEAQLSRAQRMESVGILAGGIAHDFNNLLGAITMFGELAASDIPEGDPRRADIDSIQDAVHRATTLTRQLLAFSRQQAMRPVVLDFNTLITDLMKMLRRFLGADIDVTTTLSPEACLVRADASQLEQVLLNLAVNAKDAMPKGGRLSITTTMQHLDDAAASLLGFERGGDFVVLSVADTGTGMSQEVAARAFEPFFTTKGSKGTGLGLATVYGIVRQSGGRVAITSEPGKGSTFTIQLPRAASETAVTESAPEKRNGATGGLETVLLAEDDPAVRLALSSVLTRLGYHVLVARNAQEALATADHHAGTVNILISDVVMPGMDGLALVQTLRKTRPALKALLVSGYVGDPIARRGVGESGIPFLAKPFTTSDVARKVREVLDAEMGSVA